MTAPIDGPPDAPAEPALPTGGAADDDGDPGDAAEAGGSGEAGDAAPRRRRRRRRHREAGDDRAAGAPGERNPQNPPAAGHDTAARPDAAEPAAPGDRPHGDAGPARGRRDDRGRGRGDRGPGDRAGRRDDRPPGPRPGGELARAPGEEGPDASARGDGTRAEGQPGDANRGRDDQQARGRGDRPRGDGRIRGGDRHRGGGDAAPGGGDRARDGGGPPGGSNRSDGGNRGDRARDGGGPPGGGDRNRSDGGDRARDGGGPSGGGTDRNRSDGGDRARDGGGPPGGGDRNRTDAGDRARDGGGPSGGAADRNRSDGGDRARARGGDPARPGEPARGSGDRHRGGGERGGSERGGGERARGSGIAGGDRARGGDERTRGDNRPSGDAAARGRDGRPGRGERRGGEREAADRSAEADLPIERSAAPALEPPTARLEQRRPAPPADDPDADGPAVPAVAWGSDEPGPPPEVVLAADLPVEPDDDLDPLSRPLADLPAAPLGDDIASVAGVRLVPGGRVQWCDAGDADYARGERVLVDGERGTRLAWIAVAPARRAVRDRNLRRVIRRASEQDLRGERDGEADRAHALRIAKDKAAALRLPLKVFRVEVLGAIGRGARLNVYYTTDERLDLRDFIRDVSSALGGSRVELRQLGVRDEAKAVGGIGSCGLTLCCTTWLPDFVPVSIKMAKDQGLVLSPTKVSGQCGRLKCCLVYEQAGYAELRKGLPKLGKRVVGARGEGRVVEVDVLRQRVRVSYGPGDTEVVAAAEVKPLFPSGNPQAARGGARPPDDDPDADDADDAADDDGPTDDPSALTGQGATAADDALPDDDPSTAT